MFYGTTSFYLHSLYGAVLSLTKKKYLNIEKSEITTLTMQTYLKHSNRKGRRKDLIDADAELVSSYVSQIKYT